MSIVTILTTGAFLLVPYLQLYFEKLSLMKCIYLYLFNELNKYLHSIYVKP